MELQLENSAMVDKEFAKDVWWMMLVRGIVLIIFGFMAVAWPGITLVVLSFLFAVYLLVDGVVSIVSSIRSLANHKAWFLRIILGLLQFGIGVYLLSNGALLTVATFVVFLGLIFFAQGLVTIVEAFANHHDGGFRFLMAIGGLLGIVAGIIMLRYPIASGVTFAWVVGLYGIIEGTITVAMSFSFRSMAKQGQLATPSASSTGTKSKKRK